MNKLTILLAAFLAFAGFASAQTVTPTTPANRAIKTCADFSGVTWQTLGFNWPASLKFPSPQEACNEILKTHPDAASSASLWAAPFVYLEWRMGQSCFNVVVGDRQQGGAYNQQSTGNTLRWREYATREEVLAMVLRAAVPLYLGMCTVTPEQLSAATAVIVATTKEQLDALKLELERNSNLSREWVAELRLRIDAKVAELQRQGAANAGQINILTGLAAVLEGYLRKYFALDPSKSGNQNGKLVLVFRNLDGQEVRYELQAQGSITVVAEKDSEGFLVAIVINGERTPLRPTTTTNVSYDTVVFAATQEKVTVVNCRDAQSVASDVYVLKVNGKVAATARYFDNKTAKTQGRCHDFAPEYSNTGLRIANVNGAPSWVFSWDATDKVVCNLSPEVRTNPYGLPAWLTVNTTTCKATGVQGEVKLELLQRAFDWRAGWLSNPPVVFTAAR